MSCLQYWENNSHQEQKWKRKSSFYRKRCSKHEHLEKYSDNAYTRTNKLETEKFVVTFIQQQKLEKRNYMDTWTKPSFGCTTCDKKTYSPEPQPDIFLLCSVPERDY